MVQHSSAHLSPEVQSCEAITKLRLQATCCLLVGEVAYPGRLWGLYVSLGAWQVDMSMYRGLEERLKAFPQKKQWERQRLGWDGSMHATTPTREPRDRRLFTAQLLYSSVLLVMVLAFKTR